MRAASGLEVPTALGLAASEDRPKVDAPVGATIAPAFLTRRPNSSALHWAVTRWSLEVWHRVQMPRLTEKPTKFRKLVVSLGASPRSTPTSFKIHSSQ